MSDVLRIACVDDDASICAAMVAFLTSHGYDAQAFGSAEAFLQSDHVKDTWCLIADVHLPGISGLELQQRLRDSGFDIPIIFVTAHAEETLRARAMNAGAVCFLRKPVLGADFLACIESIRAKSGDDN